MADSWLAHSPLGTPEGSGRYAHGSAGSVILRELPLQTMLDLRLDVAHAGAREAAANALGFDLPLAPNTSGSAHGRSALWLGPDEWLVVSPAPDMPPLATALAGHAASIVDVSDLRAVFQLAGPMSRDVLCKGCSVDLHPRAFATGAVALTALARVRVILHQLDQTPAYDVYVERSVAGYMRDWLCDAMGEYLGAVA
jgi:sarcosine oxidase subunit gamma